MNEQLKEFYKNNAARIGDDFNRNPSIYYDSLSTALYHYFKTFKEKRDTYHMSLGFERNTRESLSFNYSDLENTTGCLIALGRYFEFFFKKTLLNHIPQEDFSSKSLFYCFEIIQEEIRINSSLDKYNFLLDDKVSASIQEIRKLRNSLTHDGSIYPNNHALDFLVSQQVLPIVQQIYDADKISLNGFIPHYFRTNSNINIIKRICDIEFSFKDFSNEKEYDELVQKLVLLSHLKEMGRACHYNSISVKRNVSFYEPYYDNPVGRSERIAWGENNRDDFYNIRECPCCGVKSLVVYRKEVKDIFKSGVSFISWFKCYTCTYEVKNNMGDPFNFGLFTSPVFPEN